VNYLNPEEIYPKTKEKTGYWLGPVPSVGDFLTYYIYTDDKEQIITQSVTHPFKKGPFQAEDLRLGFDPDLDPEPEGADGLLDLGVTEITQPCVHMCNGLFICQLYLLPDLLDEMDCKEDMPLMLPFALFRFPLTVDTSDMN
jgi:hypothetical protein